MDYLKLEGLPPLKLTNYIVISGMDSVIRNKIKDTFIFNFSKGKKNEERVSIKRILEDGTMDIVGENDYKFIFIPKYTDIDDELKPKSKTLFSEFMKFHLSNEPELDVYLNSIQAIIEDMANSETISAFVDKTRENYAIELSFNSSAIGVQSLLPFLNLSFGDFTDEEYKRLLIALLEEKANMENRLQRIYFLDQPESFLTRTEQNSIMELLRNKSIDDIVIINTDSEYFLKQLEIDSFNFFKGKENLLFSVQNLYEEIKIEDPFDVFLTTDVKNVLQEIFNYVGSDLFYQPKFNNHQEKNIFIKNGYKLYAIVSFLNKIGIGVEMDLVDDEDPYTRYVIHKFSN